VARLAPALAAEGSVSRKGDVAVVTGAGSGIGRHVALGLLGAGFRVALAGRREDALRGTLSQSTAPPESAAVVPVDVGEPAAVRRLFALVGDRFDRVDLLVNNAGIFGSPGPLEDLRYEDWRRVVDTNLTGAFLCAQAAFRTMRDQVPQGGRIINTGSLSAHVPRPHAIAYTATKHAVTGLTKSISLEGRPYRIACGQIDVGNAATEMTTVMRTGVLQADGSVAVEPVMDVAHVASAVLYMASLPLDANVQFMTIMAAAMPYVGRG
jgi:NAD(P)-dependent dehydrogenase (short-subunit alcohol dehydrogenase family)